MADPVVPSGILVMAEVALRERIDADLGTLFEFQADPEASAMAAFPSRDLPAFLDVDLHRPLHAHVADHNVGSRRVLEKCGFVLDHSAQEEDVLEHVLVLTD